MSWSAAGLRLSGFGGDMRFLAGPGQLWSVPQPFGSLSGSWRFSRVCGAEDRNTLPAVMRVRPGAGHAATGRVRPGMPRRSCSPIVSVTKLPADLAVPWTTAPAAASTRGIAAQGAPAVPDTVGAPFVSSPGHPPDSDHLHDVCVIVLIRSVSTSLRRRSQRTLS
jgi:hypothetical protein